MSNLKSEPPAVAARIAQLHEILSEMSSVEYLCDPLMDDPPCPTCQGLFDRLAALLVDAEGPRQDTDLERYDRASVIHAREREQAYRRTLWAAAAAVWPKPLRISRVLRDAYTPAADLQSRTDHATDELLIYAPAVDAEGRAPRGTTEP